MATARQLVALLSSLNEGDEEQVYSIALQVAATEARRGRHSIANELKQLVEQGRSRRNLRSLQGSRSEAVVPINKLRGELQTLLRSSSPELRLNDLILPTETYDRLNQVVKQQRKRDELRRHALVPTATILLIGPPGSGKTMTASAIAGELHIPLYAIRFDSLITRYLGETAAKLRLIFDQIASSRGVYLFDEFDAIGAKRTAENDIGEMRRILNSFLQFLEEDRNTDSPLLCATNHPDLLDRALFRRFDEVVEYNLPSDAVAFELLHSKLKGFGFSASWWPCLSNAAQGLSHAELVGAAEDTMKEVILNQLPSANTAIILANLQRRSAIRETLSTLER